MFNYFTNYYTNNNDENIRYSISRPFKWNVLKGMYINEANKVIEYYRKREYNMPNNNMLVKLIKLLSRSTALQVLDYMQYIDNDIKYISKQLGITSTVNNGVGHNDVLLGSGNNEIFMLTDYDIDMYGSYDDIIDTSMIRVIYTENTNVYYPVLFKHDNILLESTIFEIDIKGLMLQYYYWSKNRMANDRDVSPNVFIPTIVIPNLIYSYTDYAIWNRFKSIYNNIPITDYYDKHPISAIDYTKQIDKILKDVVKKVKKEGMKITQFINHLPTIYSDTGYDVLYINNNYYNRNNKWILWVSRLVEITEIHKMLGPKGQRYNKELFNQVPYAIKNMIRRESSYIEKINEYDIMLLEEAIEYVKKKI